MMMTMRTRRTRNLRLASSGGLAPHLPDGLSIVATAEDRRSGDERVRSGLCRRTDVIGLDPAIDLEAYRAACPVDAGARIREFAQGGRNELLTAKAGIHRHDEHHVEQLEGVVEVVERRGGIEHQSRLAAVLADQGDGAIDVLGGFRVKGDESGAGGGEVRHDAIDRADYQMHVDRRLDAVPAQRL